MGVISIPLKESVISACVVRRWDILGSLPGFSAAERTPTRVRISESIIANLKIFGMVSPYSSRIEVNNDEVVNILWNS